MGKIYDTIDDRLRTFISNQQMFFVATSPLSQDGHVNVSPKGLDTFRILDDTTVAYTDFVGSGIETVAHLKENGRIVIMFCAFTGPPNIVRLHGQGETLEPQHPDFASLQKQFPETPSLRAIIRISCHRISDSCGFGVPFYDFKAHRTQLPAWAVSKGQVEVDEYIQTKNRVSIDGLPGITE